MPVRAQNETAINTAQREVDEMAYELLSGAADGDRSAIYLAVIKINGDLERIGDMAVSIAVRTLDLLEQDPLDLPVDIAGMGDFAGRMIRTALQSLLDGDALVAESVRDMDDEIDRMNRVAITDLTKVVRESPECADQALPAILISRNLERIADHATNIATDVIFWVGARMCGISCHLLSTESTAEQRSGLVISVQRNFFGRAPGATPLRS